MGSTIMFICKTAEENRTLIEEGQAVILGQQMVLTEWASIFWEA